MMTHDDTTLTKLLRQGWRGETASDLMAEAAERIDALKVVLTHRTAQLERLTSAVTPRRADRSATHGSGDPS